MAINLAGYLYSDNGTLIDEADVTLIASDGTTEDTTTTNATGVSGYWAFAEADEDIYDIKIQSGSQIRYIKGKDKLSVAEIDVRNNAAATTPAFTFTNYTNTASNQIGRFRSLNTTRADGDEIYLSFNLVNDNAEETEFARITAEANDVSNGSEDGEIRFSVMKAGTLTEVWNLNSSTAGATSLDINADSFTIGAGGDTDITLTFDANSNDGVITWMEDEDYFKFSDDILMNSTEKIQFYDTGIYIYSSTDGQLDLVADTEIQIAATTIDINGAVALNGAITGATNITLSGELDAATLDLSSSADIAGDLVLSGGADGALQFTNAGENSIKIPDNQASALIIEEANNAYITFVTSNGSEAITVAKATTFSAGITNAGTIAAGTWNGTAIATTYIADNAITNAKMADDAIDSDEIAAGAIDLAHMSSESVDEDNLHISNSGSDGQFLSKQSGNSGGLTWATPSTTASTVTVTDSTSNTNFPVVFHDESNGLLDDTGALRYNPSTGQLLVPNLTVAGTTTTVDTVTMNAQNAVVFEGATADNYETTLVVIDPTADREISLPNVGGYLPVLAAASTTQISATPAEINLIDGDTARGTTAVASGDGILINDGGTMRMTNVDTVSTYFSSHNVGGGNIVTTGDLDTGAITSGFGNINNGSSTITTTGAADLGATTVDSLTSTGDITTTGQATDWDLIDNNASALSFDASGKTGILDIVTTNSSEGVTMSGTLGVTGLSTLATVDIGGGAIDGVTLGTNSAVTQAVIDNININGTTIGHTDDTDLMTLADGVLSVAGTLDVTGSLEVATIDYQDGDLAMTIADGGGVTFAQAVTADAGVAIDNITIDGTEIDLSSGDLTLDVAGDIILDAGGVNVLPGADNTHDLGAAATRWKTVYGQQFHMDASADGIASHDYAGMSITVRVGDGADVGAWDLVCISDVTNEVQIADASAYATARVIGINPSDSAISDNSEGTILLFGIVRDDSWNWTTGQTLYLSETAGDITATAPTTSGAFVTAIGVALEPDMIYFNPSPAVIEVA